MIKAIRWNIFDRDGKYLGQYTAFAPESAFSQYMELLGKGVPVSEIQYKEVSENMGKISHHSQDYFLTPG